MAVACQPRLIGNQSITATREAVEQRGFSDVLVDQPRTSVGNIKNLHLLDHSLPLPPPFVKKGYAVVRAWAVNFNESDSE